MNASINERVTAALTAKQKDKPEVHLVSVHVRDLLNMRRLQGRLTVRQTAVLLNCGEHDIPVLVSHKLLTPLGHPPSTAQKYFSPVEVLELAGDSERMGQICDVLYQHWQVKNAAKSGKTPKRELPPNGTDDSRSKHLRGN
jgi:hypothetical protein